MTQVHPWKRIEPTIVTKIDYRSIVVKTFEASGTGRARTFATWHLEGSRAGAVIALTADKQVVIARQFRQGPERVMNELPGGGIDEGEDPEAGVRRELIEETGYVPGSMTLLGTSCRDGYTNCTWYYYLALDCELSPQGQLDDEDEQIEVRLISIPDLLEDAKHDNMTDPAAVLFAYDKLKQLEASA